ncbi:uncharacterized protein VTP21DRAFT_8484 [Calcarisporiella thermophila]|uniref:uncharacterized protein n=1 Tax=Calcarisporiella thermophila TaxID=911321 RepID=UPI0037434C35
MGDRQYDFDDIYLGMQRDAGRLRLAPSGVGWKAGEKMLTVPIADIKKIHWLRVARDFQLRITLRNGNVVKFDGFKKDDFEELKSIIKSLYHLQLENKELSLKGWNWGQTDFQGSQLLFNVSNRTMFELPLDEVTDTNLTSKNEVSLEFVLSDQSSGGKKGRVASDVDQLVEMRLFIPGTVVKEETDDIENKEGEDGEEEISAAQAFYDMVKTKADLGQVTGEGIVSFSEVLFLTPRGRYEIDMYPDFLRLRGKTYDYKIVYDNIIKLFLLPKPDDLHVVFVIGLDPPLRQGQTRYPFLVLQFIRDEELEVTLNLDDETINEKYEGKLQKSYDAPTYEVVSTIFRGLAGRKVTVPGSYKSHHGAAGIKASMKANEGHLYPLEKCFLFIPKPTTFIPHQEIESVVFSRVGTSLTSSRTFDLKFNMRSGQDYQFSSINREEHATLDEFLKSKKIKIKNELNEDTVVSYAELGEESESDEEAGGGRKRRRTEGEDMDEDESVDEDFVAEESESDVAEEYDSEAGSDEENAEEDEE